MILRLLTSAFLLQIASFQILPGGYIGQILKIHSLFDHWDLHLTEEADLSFDKFIVEHFIPFTSHEQDHSHNDLPFHQISFNSMVFASFFQSVNTPNVELFDLESSEFLIIDSHSFYEGLGVYHPPC